VSARKLPELFAEEALAARARLYQQVADALRAQVREMGLTLNEVSEVVSGTGPASHGGHTTKLLNGRTNLTLASISDIATAMGCRVEIRITRPTLSGSAVPHKSEEPKE
jgi:hypothetical protein